MKTLLINNIGNRHLYYQGKYVSKKEFRDETRRILNNWQTEKQFVKLNILSQALEKLEFLPDKIVLFATDQGEDNPYSSQDTLYVAEIIKQILHEDFDINEVEIIIISNNPSDENKLIPEYKKRINGLHYRNSEYFWQFLDAGGTPQQKLACKLLIPEIHPNNKFIYLNNVEGVEKKDLLKKKTDSIEEFFTLKNVKNLVKLGYYDSAVELISNSNKAYRFVLIASNRLRNIYKKISFGSKEKNIGVVKQYSDQIPVIRLWELQNLITTEAFFIYGEFIARAQLFLTQKNYNDFILNFHQSLEFLLIDFLLRQAEEMGYNQLKGYKPNDKVTNFIEEYEPDLKYPESIPSRLSVAIKIANNKHWHDTEQVLKQYADIHQGYQKHIEKKVLNSGLDSLRNTVAHRGKALTETDIKPIEQNFINLSELLQLDINSYNNLNTEIFKRLFQ